jgi:HlyD family secretion protein
MRWNSLSKVLLALGVVVACVAAAEQASPEAREPGHTYPSGRSEHTLKIPDIVLEVKVKEGDVVKAGDVLAIEDCREEEIKLQIIKAEAESNAAVNAATATLGQKKVEVGRFEHLFAAGQAASTWEVEKAKLEVLLAEADLEKARLQKKQAQLQAKQQEELIEEMRLTSKIDGIVEKLYIHPGEVVDPQKPAVTVVNNDPLWVEFRPFSNVALRLQLGQELGVYYGGEPQAKKAKVIFLSPVVDRPSDRRLVRLELANPEGRPSGLKVEVEVAGGSSRVAEGTR